MLYKFIIYWRMIFRILFSNGHKIFLMSEAQNPNLGDQAQRMCTLELIKKNYPNSILIELGNYGSTVYYDYSKGTLFEVIACYIKLVCLKLKVKDTDLFLGHSGYFMVDHHTGWKMFTVIMKYFPRNKMVILPQTVNFYTPVIKEYVSRCFLKDSNVTLMCRDSISYEISKKLFPKTKLLLFPDIVTSLIGTKTYNGKREGVLFCMRDDVEQFYKSEQIDALMARFGNIRMEKVDTTLHGVNTKYVNQNRNQLIWEAIDKFATYQVVITDRYHGTIFSAIASTPVIVINSADHKLSSGVNWFPKEQFGEYVQFAKDLDDVYEKAITMLSRTNLTYNNPPYFKQEYWDKFKECCESEDYFN